MNTGTISQIIGVVVDVHFPEDLPDIYSALEVPLQDNKKLIIAFFISLQAFLMMLILIAPATCELK